MFLSNFGWRAEWTFTEDKIKLEQLIKGKRVILLLSLLLLWVHYTRKKHHAIIIILTAIYIPSIATTIHCPWLICYPDQMNLTSEVFLS